MEKRSRNEIVFRKEIVTDEPNAYARATLEIEGVPEGRTVELREMFNSFYAKVEKIVKEDPLGEEIDLTEAEQEEITLTPEQEEELKKKFLFAINKDGETGGIEICPMNEKNRITLHGAEEAEWFIKQLRIVKEETSPLAAGSEEGQPQKRKIMSYKDGRPYFTEVTETADYVLEFADEMTEAELAEVEKMKTLWYIEQDPEKKIIEIRPGNDNCISLHGAQEARHFIEVLEEAIQETF